VLNPPRHASVCPSVRNPFEHLHRDADIEGQTDGFTQEWSHGKLSGITDRTMVRWCKLKLVLKASDFRFSK